MPPDGLPVTIGLLGWALPLPGLAPFLSRVLRHLLGRAAAVVNSGETLRKVGSGVVMATVGLLASRLQLHVFDKLFLRKGRLKNALKE